MFGIVPSNRAYCPKGVETGQEIGNSQSMLPFQQSTFKIDQGMALIVKDIRPLLDFSRGEPACLIKSYMFSYGNLERLNFALEILEKQLDKCGIEGKALEEEVNTLGTKIKELKEKIKAERRWRAFAWEDLIPGLGFREKIASQYPTRVIPFYSCVFGLFSFITQALEKAQKKLKLKLNEKRRLEARLAKIKRNFTNIEKEIKKRRIEIYGIIGHNIKILINLIDNFLLQCEIKEKCLNKELLDIVNQYNLAHQNQIKLELEINDLKNELIELNSQNQQLKTEINELKNSISESEIKIEEEEEIRTYAWTDLIPGVGLIGGLVTERYERIIPFYSSIRGIISIAEQSVEIEDRRLNLKKEEKKQLKLNKKNIKREVEDKNDKKIQNIYNLAKIKMDKSSKDAEIAQFGRTLTYLRNASSFLKLNLHKYKCVDGEVQGKPLLIELDIFETSEMLGLVKELENIKITFSSLVS